MKVLGALAALMLLVACSGDSTGPTDTRTPRLGRYRYVGDGLGTGTMTVTFASPDSVAATFDVKNANGGVIFSGPAQLGFWNIDAYVLYARYSASLVYAHRITRAGDGMTCAASVVGLGGVTNDCTLSYIGP